MSEPRTISQIMREPNGYPFAGIVRENPDRGEWLIGPVGVHRDSDSIAESNWRVVVAEFSKLDPDGLDHEVYRFGHWAVGWVEEIAYRPGSPIAKRADEIRESLAGYSILDDDDHTSLECEQVDENWASWQEREVRRDLLAEFVSRISEPDDMTADELEEWIDGIDGDLLWDVVRDLGDICDGSLHLSKSDISKAADALLESTCDECGETRAVRFVDNATHTANVCRVCVPSGDE